MEDKRYVDKDGYFDIETWLADTFKKDPNGIWIGHVSHQKFKEIFAILQRYYSANPNFSFKAFGLVHAARHGYSHMLIIEHLEDGKTNTPNNNPPKTP